MGYPPGRASAMEAASVCVAMHCMNDVILDTVLV